MSTTKRRSRIPKELAAAVYGAERPTLQRDALYGVPELRAITGLGERTVYAILRTARDQSRGMRRKYLVTGAEFLRLRAAFYGYTDVA